MKLTFTESAWEDYLYWQRIDTKVLSRINTLIKECLRTPLHGTGKPEPLRGDLKGYWSRRIDQEHRLVYKPGNDGQIIIQCRFHY